MPSDSLQIGNGQPTPSFVQQGSVDWVAFGGTTITASISVLQRCSAAGVQPATIAGSLALGNQFKLSKQGTQNMDIALKKLSGIHGFGNLLYYGFGYRSFINILTETVPGVNLVALCACLVETHSVPNTAEILAALWKLEAFPEEFKPSTSQLVSLANACAGVVAATVFGQISDMMLGDLRQHLRISSSDGLPRRSLSPPEDIARALHGLFQISRGKQERVEIVGGPSCAFIGAFAHWLLGLTVQVESDAGDLIYKDVEDRAIAQVKIHYRNLNEASNELSVTSATFVLRDNDTLFAIDESHDGMFLCVRTVWDGCLERVFWNSARKLTQYSRLLGQFIGSAARIYAAMARGESSNKHFQRDWFADFIEGMHGRGLVDNVGQVFPELDRVEGLHSVMLEALHASMDQAFTNIQTAINSLITLCDCGYCNLSHPINALGHPIRTATDVQGNCADTYCVLVTAMTVLYIVRLVASLEMHAAVNPTITGLQQLYGRFDRRTQNDRYHSGKLSKLANILALEPYGNFDGLCLPINLMQDAQCLFTGCQTRRKELVNDRSRTASSKNGICCYVGALKNISSNAASLRRIHILPGRIQYGNREYNVVRDLEVTLDSPLPAATLSVPSTEIPFDPREEKLQIRGLVREDATDSALQFGYEATFDGKSVRLYPGSLTEKVLRRTGFMTCSKQRCLDQLMFPCVTVQEGWSGLPPWEETSLRHPRHASFAECYIWPFEEHDVARCVAVAMAPFDDYIFVRNGECLPCCTMALANEPYSVII